MSRASELLQFVHDELVDDATEVAVDDELLVSGLIDSLGLMRLIAFIDQDLGVDVPYGDIVIENFESIARIDTYLASVAPLPDSPPVSPPSIDDEGQDA